MVRVKCALQSRHFKRDYYAGRILICYAFLSLRKYYRLWEIWQNYLPHPDPIPEDSESLWWGEHNFVLLWSTTR